METPSRFKVAVQKRDNSRACPEIDPIPMRPPGYFNGCYSKEEIEEENELAKSSVKYAPNDLE